MRIQQYASFITIIQPEMSYNLVNREIIWKCGVELVLYYQMDFIYENKIYSFTSSGTYNYH